jgi:hypothetical protein
VAIAPFELKQAALLLGFVALQPATALEQGHLRGEVAAFAHFHRR